MSRRYFVEHPLQVGPVTLSGQEGRHLSQVMRAKPGELVTLFDGRGDEFVATVTAVKRGEADLQITERLAISRESSFRLTVGVALPKGDRQRWLVEKLVELGASRLTPLVTRRGVAQPGDAAIARLRRAVIESSKQCGRNRLLEVTPAAACEAFFQDAAATAVRWLAHPNATPLAHSLPADAEEIHVAVGPEGGFDDNEIALARAANWQEVGLGPRILRVETAAVAVAAWLAMGR